MSDERSKPVNLVIDTHGRTVILIGASYGIMEEAGKLSFILIEKDDITRRMLLGEAMDYIAALSARINKNVDIVAKLSGMIASLKAVEMD